jgi:hypothetical protein
MTRGPVSSYSVRTTEQVCLPCKCSSTRMVCLGSLVCFTGTPVRVTRRTERRRRREKHITPHRRSTTWVGGGRSALCSRYTDANFYLVRRLKPDDWRSCRPSRHPPFSFPIRPRLLALSVLQVVHVHPIVLALLEWVASRLVTSRPSW